MNPNPAQDAPPVLVPPVGLPVPPNAEKKPDKKEYDRNHSIRVCGTTSNAKGELLVQFIVNLTNNERYPNRSETDYRGQLTMRQMQNSAVAVERLSHSLKPHPMILIPDPYEDYAQYLKECFVEWENDMGEDDSVPKETKVLQAQGWYCEQNTWYLVSGRQAVWDITNGSKLSEEEIQKLDVNFEFNGTEEVYVEDQKQALQLFSELISTFHTVGEEKNRSFLPCAICFFLKSLQFIPREKMSKQNKVGLFLSGHKPGSGKTTVSKILMKMSLNEKEEEKCYLANTSSLIGMFQKSHDLTAVFCDEIKEKTSFLQDMAAIIDSKWSNSPHTTKTEDIYATSAMVFCGNFSREELMSFKFKRESILQEKTMSKTTVLHCGNKPLSGAGPARDRCFEIAKELRNHLPTLLHLSMNAMDGQMTEDERQMYLHIHQDDRYILDLVEYRRFALHMKKAMQEAEVDVPEVWKPDEIDVSSMAYYFLKGRTSLKDVIKYCVLNDLTDVLVLTRRQTTGVLGFKVLDQHFLGAPDEIKKFVHSCESVPLIDKGEKKRMKFMPIHGLSKKDLELVLRNRISVAAELCKVMMKNLEFSNQIQVSFVNSMMKQGLKRKRFGGKMVVMVEGEQKRKKTPETKEADQGKHKQKRKQETAVDQGQQKGKKKPETKEAVQGEQKGKKKQETKEVDQGRVDENFAETYEELNQNDVNVRADAELDRDRIEGNVECAFAPVDPLADEFLNPKPGGSGGLQCNNPDCTDFTKSFKRQYTYNQHILSKKHRMATRRDRPLQGHFRLQQRSTVTFEAGLLPVNFTVKSGHDRTVSTCDSSQVTIAQCQCAKLLVKTK